MVHRLQGLGQVDAELFAVEEGGHQLVEIEIAAGAAGHVVHRLFAVMTFDDLRHGLAAERGLDVGLVVHRKADDELVAAGRADAMQDLP